jgi:hypothetical protein
LARAFSIKAAPRAGCGCLRSSRAQALKARPRAAIVSIAGKGRSGPAATRAKFRCTQHDLVNIAGVKDGGEADPLATELLPCAAIPQLDPLHRGRGEHSAPERTVLTPVWTGRSRPSPTRTRCSRPLPSSRPRRLPPQNQEPTSLLLKAAVSRSPTVSGSRRGNSGITHLSISFLREVQAGFHPLRYAAFSTPPSPTFGHRALRERLATDEWWQTEPWWGEKSGI